MSEFVEECRREWTRLRVPDPVANEMAADLAADLEEAEAEGASPEEVLGSGAFDPRSFAAAWAAERGVIPPPPAQSGRAPTRSRLPAAVAVCALVAIIVVGLAMVISSSGSEQRVALASTGGPLPRLLAPRLRLLRPGRLVSPLGPRRIETPVRAFSVPLNGPGIPLHTVGLILLLGGTTGLILLVLYWSQSGDSGRWPRRRSQFSGTSGGSGYP